MKDLRKRAPVAVLIVMLGLGLAVLMSGCQTLREVSNLRNVDFRIDRVADARLAGVRLNDVREYSDIGARDMLRLSAAIADGEMPLSFTVHVGAQNPSTNDTNARLTRMDWTLLLQDRETISGTFDRDVVIPPGEPTDIPITMEVDLVRFFDDNLRGIVDLALAVGGEGEAQNVKLRARPTINTALGPIKYPNDILIVNEDVGGQESGPVTNE